MVPENARAVVRSTDAAAYDHIKELAEEFRRETGHHIRTKGVGKAFEITTQGRAAHGAAPQEGLNAISILFEFLGRLNFAADDINDFIDFYNTCIGYNVYGENIGCAAEDEESGRLSFNNGLVSFDGESVSVHINIRYPVTYTQDQIYDGIMPFADKYDLGIVKLFNFDPVYFDMDSSLIKTMVDVYREKTGDEESGAIVMGGGTYAKAFKNLVAYGGLFPGDPDIMHQKNEKIEIKRFLQMIDIYSEVILRLSSEDFEIC